MTRRGSFGPVVLLGLATAALATVAGNKPWTDVQAPGGECELYAPRGLDFDALALGSPLAGALGLLLLATWGVMLVTRARTRRVMAAFGLVVALGYVATAAVARSTLKDQVLAEAEERVGSMPAGCHAASVWMDNAWWPLALGLGLLAVITAVLALLLAPHWPEMGSKYDAPGVAPTELPPAAERSSVDLWKSLDAGHDPTLGPDDHDVPRA